MFVLKSQVTCRPEGLPANYGAESADYAARLTAAMAEAQGAFNLGTYRPDLAPNGIPWGDIPEWLGRVMPGQEVIGEPCEPPPGLGTWGNGRVVDLPFCSPMSTAQRYSPPPTEQQCAATGYSATTLGPAFINGVSPYWYHPVGEIVLAAQATNTPIPAPPPGYTGIGPLEWLAMQLNGVGDDDKAASVNQCRELAEGNLSPADVTPETLRACVDAGYDIPGVDATGVSGLSGCTSCTEECTSCSGNYPVAPQWEESPADRARNGAGMGQLGPWLGVAALVALAAYGVKGRERGRGLGQRQGRGRA